jgi:hypothetical protein
MESATLQYKLTPDANWGTASPTNVILVAPRELVFRYGYPINDGDSESFGSYVFTSSDGTVFTVYFRAYDIWSLFLKLFRRSFWRSRKPIELTVAATRKENGNAFAKWLACALGGDCRTWP